MKKEFTPGFIRDPKVEAESLEIEVTDRQVILDNPHEEISKEELADQTGYSVSSGGFGNAISKLNSLGLIIKNNNHIKLNPELLE